MLEHIPKNIAYAQVLILAIIFLHFNKKISLDEARVGLTINLSYRTQSELLGQEYDGIEVFAGAAMLSRCLRNAGMTVGSLEIDFWKDYANARQLPRGIGNPIHLLTSAGMAFLGFITYHYFVKPITYMCKQLLKYILGWAGE